MQSFFHFNLDILKIKLSFFYIFAPLFSISQDNTIGTLFVDIENSLPGYNLFYPNNQSSVFLVDNCGQVINVWEDVDNSRPGTAYITKEGNLLRSKTNGDLVNNTFGAGGAAGVIELLNWENELIWRKVIADSITRQHHDIFEMPNRNILFIAWERKFEEEIKELGFDTINNNQDDLWFDCIVEYNPQLDSIVWRWCSYDHTIQDFDSTKANFGIVSENPQLIDINYQEFSFGRQDFMHSNSVAYNPDLDQVVLSVRNFSEVWIIDHSTTMDEAASSNGGNQKKGGNLLHRWGNPKAYMQGDSTDKILHYQHDAKWVLDSSSPYFGEILVYNNMVADEVSYGTIYNAPIDENGNYIIENQRFLPQSQTRNISHPDTVKQHSTAGSNIQLLPNGNFLLNAARQGRVIELTDDEIPVWEYLIPIKMGQIAPQGTELSLSDNFNFKTIRYSTDYEGFEGKDLSTKGYLELDPNQNFCVLSPAQEIIKTTPKLYPNPTNDYIYLDNDQSFSTYQIYNSLGNLITESRSWNSNQIDVSFLQNGTYFIHLDRKVNLLFTIVR